MQIYMFIHFLNESSQHLEFTTHNQTETANFEQNDQLGRLPTLRALKRPNFTSRISWPKMVIALERLYNIWTFRLPLKFFMRREKNHFALAILRIFPKIEFKRFWKFESTVKIPESYVEQAEIVKATFRHAEHNPVPR